MDVNNEVEEVGESFAPNIRRQTRCRRCQNLGHTARIRNCPEFSGTGGNNAQQRAGSNRRRVVQHNEIIVRRADGVDVAEEG